jgi:serine/threonine protein kinase
MPPKHTAYAPIDLSPYGIQMVLRKGINIDLALANVAVNEGSFSRSQGKLTFPSGEYSVGSYMGEGTYAQTYQAVDGRTNTAYVVKVVKPRTDMRSNILNTLKECIIHILLERESRTQPEGPHVPKFYEVAYDTERRFLLIRMERLYGTLADKYNGATPEQNDANVLESLAGLAQILNFFYGYLRFNHRDLKSDNLMYNYGPGGKLVVKLIDFGFACLTWHGVQISGASYFAVTDPCYIPSRDLTQYVYEIHRTYRGHFSQRIRAMLEDILTFELKGGNVCQLFRGCRVGRQQMRGWADIYLFLKSKNVKNPKAVPEAVYERVMHMLGRPVPRGQPTPIEAVPRQGEAAETVKCLPEQVMNPKTRRCVRRSGAVGRRIMRATQRKSPSPLDPAFARMRRRVATLKLKACKEGQVRNPVTRRCGKRVPTGAKVRPVKRRGTEKLKPCKEGKVRNPVTRRCLRDPRLGKKAPVKRKRPTAKLRPCKEGQVRNPATRRCKSMV